MDATLLLRGAWVGVGWDVNVHLHLHTTWMLRCCYVGHGLGWGGLGWGEHGRIWKSMFHPRSQQRMQPAKRWILRCGIGFTAGCGAATVKEMCGQPCQLCFTETEVAASQLPKRPAPLMAAWPCFCIGLNCHVANWDFKARHTKTAFNLNYFCVKQSYKIKRPLKHVKAQPRYCNARSQQ